MLRIELRGEPAGILRLCVGAKKKPGAQGAAGLVEHVKLVAGTRNHLNLLVTARCG